MKPNRPKVWLGPRCAIVHYPVRQPNASGVNNSIMLAGTLARLLFILIKLPEALARIIILVRP